MNTKYDENPEFGGMINFASNCSNSQDIETVRLEAFKYGFRLGWQTHYYEVKEVEDKQEAFDAIGRTNWGQLR